MPPILLEGDVDPTPPISGPGERYALGPTPPPPVAPSSEPLQELPEAYGTGRLFLTARDPHWLYAAWDLTAEQRAHYAALAKDGQLTIRTYTHQIGLRPDTETHVGREAKSWFIYVHDAGTRHFAELGYYDPEQIWKSIASSAPTLTPPESMSEETGLEFATIPPEVSLQKLFEAVQEAVPPIMPLNEAIQEITAAPDWTPLAELAPVPDAAASLAPRVAATSDQAPTAEDQRSDRLAVARPANAESIGMDGLEARQALTSSIPRHTQKGHRDQFRAISPTAPVALRAVPGEWTPAQAQALAKVVRLDSERRVWMGSLEITELVRRHLEISGGGLGEKAGEGLAPGPSSPVAAFAGVGISSPLQENQEQGGEEDKRFWFTINAELVLYGATETDAKVSVGGRQIRLRPDGTFSYRFALPDGEYPLRISAEPADGHTRRSIRLQFSRRTQAVGRVGVHPQSADLQPPVEKHLT